MKLSYWLSFLMYSFAWILLQTTDTDNINLCDYNDIGDFVCRVPTLPEKTKLILKSSWKFMYNFTNFWKAFFLFLLEAFDLQHNNSIELMSLMNHYATQFQREFLDICYVIKGKPGYGYE